MIVEERVLEGVDQLDFLFFAEVVARRLFLRTGVAVRQLGVKIDLVAARLLVAVHTRRLHDCAHQQIDFLVVAAALDLLFDQFDQAQLGRCLDMLDGLRLVPLVAQLPAIDRAALDPQVAGDGRNAPALPVQGARGAARLGFRHGQFGDYFFGFLFNC